MDRIAQEQVELTRGGQKVRLKKLEALRHAQLGLAMKGNPLAMRDINRDVVNLEAKKEAIERAKIEAAEQAAEEKAKRDHAWFKHLVELKDKQATAWKRAAAEGRVQPDEPWPHPDDVLINYTTRTARVRGPFDSDDLEDWEYLRRSRDHHLARVVYHTMLEDRIHRLISKVWLAALVECDLELPKRWQISRGITPASIPLMAMPFSRLEALVSEGAAIFESGLSNQRMSRDTYGRANRKWGPLIKMLGFRSLRHMERFGETHA